MQRFAKNFCVKQGAKTEADVEESLHEAGYYV
jgi:hypothetical protein